MANATIGEFDGYTLVIRKRPDGTFHAAVTAPDGKICLPPQPTAQTEDEARTLACALAGELAGLNDLETAYRRDRVLWTRADVSDLD